MLYLTTRDKFDAFTAHRTLAADFAPNGGRFLPYKMPVLTAQDWEALTAESFGGCVAAVLNRFFSSRLTGWDVELAVGRYPVKLLSTPNRVTVAQTWRNLEGSYEKLERSLASLLNAERVCSWVRIAVRLAVLTAVFVQLRRQGMEGTMDVAAPAGDFLLPMAVIYGRDMGLPIGSLIIGCENGSQIWDLLHQGELNAQDSEPAFAELERLIHWRLGVAEAKRYAQAWADKGIYKLLPESVSALSDGIFSAVVSADRLDSVILSVYLSGKFVLSRDPAVAYGALMDYRTRTGGSRTALLLADRDPMEETGTLSRALKMTDAELKTILEKA